MIKLDFIEQTQPSPDSGQFPFTPVAAVTAHTQGRVKWAGWWVTKIDLNRPEESGEAGEAREETDAICPGFGQ